MTGDRRAGVASGDVRRDLGEQMAKETVGTLRAYFFIVGVLGGAFNVFALLATPLGVSSVVSLGGLAIAGAFLFLGLRLKELIVTAPKVCEQIVIGAAVVAVVMAITNVLLGASPIAGIQTVGWLIIAWYLVTNLRRLSAAAPSVPAPEAPAQL